MMLTNSLPVIGITTHGRNDVGEFSLLSTYVDAIRMTGGVPILLTPGEQHLDRILSLVDGLVFSGGGDIEPLHYDGTHHPTIYKIDPERDAFELALAKRALQHDLPILGICRGLQILSVVSGAQLLPHVPDAVGETVVHRMSQCECTRHWVDVMPETRLAQAVGALRMEVVSWHHQAVKVVPPGWRVIAQAPDGLIEAIEHRQHAWAMALQWHPEMSAATDPLQRAIFEAFIEAARSPNVCLHQSAA